MQEHQIESVEASLELIENLTEQAWAEIEEKIMGALKTLIEELLEEELPQRLGAERCERTEKRKGYRGGHHQRGLTTRFGHIPDLSVPRPAQGPAPFTLLDRYERRRWDVDAVIGKPFLRGVSTRKIQGVAKDVFGIPVPAQTLSKTTTYLEEELKHHPERELADDVESLFLYGIWEKVREIGVEKRVMLCAFGIHEGGEKEILSFRMADSEDLPSWKGFLADLKARGLAGKKTKLVVSEGDPAPLKAIAEIYPFHEVQRRIAHRMRNVAVKLRRHNQKPVMDEARLIFGAPNKKEALRRFKAWRKKWIVEGERAVRCLEKGLYNCLHFYALPEEMWKKIRTTNILERAFWEMRSRTNPMGLFPNAHSANRIFYGITDYMNENWRGSHLKEISAESLT